MERTVGIIGLGLIGGSLALALKDRGLTHRILGVEANETHARRALALGLADDVLPLEDLVAASDLVVLAIPVDAAAELLPRLLDLTDKQVVMDVGSTKAGLLAAADKHPRRGRFVATHPMWGTEYSGPDAAVHGAFARKTAVICNRAASDDDALQLVEELYRALDMNLIDMNADDHDVHVAYISHISHITSFALANTVLEKEREEDAIFALASGGFESTVRLAKSNPQTWAAIFMQNRENVLDVLNEHISQLRKFKSCLEKENHEYLTELMDNANRIRKIIK